MIEGILLGLMNIVLSLTKILVMPIDLMLKSLVPNVSFAFTCIANLLNIIGQGIGWAISLSGLSPTAISLIVVYFTFKLTAPLLFSSIKIAIKWYNALKL